LTLQVVKFNIFPTHPTNTKKCVQGDITADSTDDNHNYVWGCRKLNPRSNKRLSAQVNEYFNFLRGNITDQSAAATVIRNEHGNG
jgi:hypothetical protein